MTIKILTDQERVKLPGEFVKLSRGWVHYELVGPDNLVCKTPMFHNLYCIVQNCLFFDKSCFVV